MKKILLFFALIVGLLASASTAMAQTVNMNSYITLTVAKDSAIKLNFTAAADGTPVRIVSGSNTQDITVGTNWTGFANYTADGTTMTVYGDIICFNCSGNVANLTALDLSHNTQLILLDCSANRLSSLDVSQNTLLGRLDCSYNQLSSLDVSNNTQLILLDCSYNQLSSLDVSNTQLERLNCSNNNLTTLDVSGCTQLMGVYCSYNYLSVLNVSDNIQLENLYCHSNSLSSLDISQNTRLKNLSCHGNDFTTATLDRIYCVLPVRSASDGARIFPLGESSSVAEQNMVASTSGANATAKNWRVLKYKTDGPHTDIATTGSYVCPEPNMSSYITLTVKSGENITLNFMAAAAGTPVRIVSGSNTRNITVGTEWRGTAYYTAYGTEMTVYGDLIGFGCGDNGANITALDLSHNTQLEHLDCSENRLSSLDVSHNTQLTELYCYDNNFTTATLDDIYCALPDRTSETNGVIQPAYSSLSSNRATVIATNKTNATAKNWKVQYYKNNTDIPTTTGTYVCGTPHTDIAEAAAEQALTLYPNPVADVLYLSATARTIRIYNVYGTEVAHATDTDRVEVSHLPAGVYTVNADGTVAKMVKR